ncbi:MAG: TonB-dependent receptor plug domain-containing protein, partial [Flavobacterium sp.]|nr:TonB-dependent receptor plug domain-containing protein [Flavobacterium sp.]
MKTLFKKDCRKGTKAQIYLGLFSVFFSLFSFSQETQKDSTKITELKEVTVSSVRAKDKNPITFTNISAAEIAPRNLGQDVPILLQYLPSVVSTTDAGNGVGYTYMRVRGSDGSRINVTLNGIPFNDSESQGTFFVNLPDFASSLESVQLQRGVGTSTNGAGAFGASLNMQTKSFNEKAYVEVSNSVGSFATRKHTIAFGTGLHNNFEMNARISNIASDGFIDRASSNMFGYFFN